MWFIHTVEHYLAIKTKYCYMLFTHMNMLLSGKKARHKRMHRSPFIENVQKRPAVESGFVVPQGTWDRATGTNGK